MFRKKKIAVIGDVMIDEYIYGDVCRISPEAPVPVVKEERKEHKLGGAGNVAVNFKALGQDVYLVGVIGEDRKQQFFGMMLDKGLTTEGIIIDNHRPTTIKTRVIGRNQHVVRIDQECTDAVSNKLLNKVKLHGFDAVVFSDYNKGMLRTEFVRKIIKSTDKPVFVDPKEDYSKFINCTVFMPNENELFALSGRKEYIAACNYLQEKINCRYVTPTLGAKGILIYDQKKPFELVNVPAYSGATVVDVTGAGDTVTSVMCTAMINGFNVHEAGRMAMFAADMTIQHIGVYAVTEKELEKYK